MYPIQDEIIALEIEDDGVGFSVEEIDSDYENSGSLGLVNMRERSELVNGVISIDSRINNGTLIKLIFPLSEEANERLRRIG
jgi:signal transduction histidine kinase